MKTDERECRGCINVGKRLKLIRWEFETKCKILVVDSSANKRVGRFFFFFKQKTAYEILRDWSSDVCSSNLAEAAWGRSSPSHPGVLTTGPSSRKAWASSCQTVSGRSAPVRGRKTGASVSGSTSAGGSTERDRKSVG